MNNVCIMKRNKKMLNTKKYKGRGALTTTG